MSYALSAPSARHLLVSDNPRADQIRDIKMAIEEVFWVVRLRVKGILTTARKIVLPRRSRHMAKTPFTMPKIEVPKFNLSLDSFKQDWKRAMTAPMPYVYVGQETVTFADFRKMLIRNQVEKPDEILPMLLPPAVTTQEIPMNVIEEAEVVIDKWYRLKKPRPTPLTVAPYFNVRKPSWAKPFDPAMAGSKRMPRRGTQKALQYASRV